MQQGSYKRMAYFAITFALIALMVGASTEWRSGVATFAQMSIIAALVSMATPIHKMTDQRVDYR